MIKIYGEDNYILHFPEITSIFYPYNWNTNNERIIINMNY